jgi:hypothetical protein
MISNIQRCIYCHDSKGTFSTKEHFFSESLGGGEWAILPSGLVCDNCQSYFGSQVEKTAICDWPFNFVRFNMAIPTKKQKPVQMDTDLGHLTAYKLPGYSMVHPKRESAPVDKSRSKIIRIPAFPQKPRLVCRALVKIAIGSLASNNSADVFGTRINAARRFARFGDLNIKWWYLERVNLKEMRKAFNLGAKAYKEPIKLETIYFDSIPAFFHLTYFFLNIITPIEPHFEMNLPQELPEGTRIYRV